MLTSVIYLALLFYYAAVIILYSRHPNSKGFLQDLLDRLMLRDLWGVNFLTKHFLFLLAISAPLFLLIVLSNQGHLND